MLSLQKMLKLPGGGSPAYKSLFANCTLDFGSRCVIGAKTVGVMVADHSHSGLWGANPECLVG